MTLRGLGQGCQSKLGNLKNVRLVPLAEDPDGAEDRLPKLAEGWQQFYIRNLYGNIEDTFNRPIESSPDGWIDVTVRERTPNAGFFSRLRDTGATRRCLNLGSYNYLGFGGVNSYCTPVVEDAVRNLPIALGSSAAELGHSEVCIELGYTPLSILAEHPTCSPSQAISPQTPPPAQSCGHKHPCDTAPSTSPTTANSSRHPFIPPMSECIVADAGH